MPGTAGQIKVLKLIAWKGVLERGFALICLRHPHPKIAAEGGLLFGSMPYGLLVFRELFTQFRVAFERSSFSTVL